MLFLQRHWPQLGYRGPKTKQKNVVARTVMALFSGTSSRWRAARTPQSIDRPPLDIDTRSRKISPARLCSNSKCVPRRCLLFWVSCSWAVHSLLSCRRVVGPNKRSIKTVRDLPASTTLACNCHLILLSSSSNIAFQHLAFSFIAPKLSLLLPPRSAPIFKMALRVVAAVIAALLLLEFGPVAWQNHYYPDNGFDTPRSTPSATYVNSIVVQNQFDPAHIHALFSEIDIYNSQGAYYCDDEFDFDTLTFPSPALFIDRTVIEGPIAFATPFVAGPPRSGHDLLLDRLLAAQAGPPTSTLPALSSDEFDVFNVAVSVVTAPLPGPRLALPSSSTSLSTLAVFFSLLMVSLIASMAHLYKLAQTIKVSSSSPSRVLYHALTAPKLVPTTGKSWCGPRLPDAKKFVPSLALIPESLLDFHGDVILKALEALARQQKHVMPQKSASLAAIAVSPAPQISSPDVVEPPALVAAARTIAGTLPTAGRAPTQNYGEAIYPGAIIYETCPIATPRSATYEAPTLTPRTPHVIYRTPAPAQTVHNPAVLYQTQAPASSSSLIYSTSDSRPTTTGPILYQIPTARAAQNPSSFTQHLASASAIYSASGSIDNPFRPYKNSTLLPSHASRVIDDGRTITLHRAPLATLEVYLQKPGVWGPQSHYYHDMWRVLLDLLIIAAFLNSAFLSPPVPPHPYCLTGFRTNT
ncbi:hypothetical protein C8F04DRAFT_1226799 [Mycena alexandri]|uniref:Uncharacterized protein n=1 Tax=Mycena alexandri TaxID=1745969 RepID=A0AAD6XFA8_9AGAR|nr:hypothetical protein C8F04DRAFT_1226799 [Mycena alexandri]